ncbi:SAM-dependent methyltransferase [Pacificitalea manganoxidans]|nr:SAM-dependent methyltransferase [Pacificitalea manganoxidans]
MVFLSVLGKVGVADLPIESVGAMHLDVLDLRNFYYRTQLGRVAQRAIRTQVTALWPEAKGQTVAGFGFAVPLLRPYLAEARRVIALMPAQQGVMPWPARMPNVSVLCEETLLPLSTGLVDKMIVMHGLETSDYGGSLLDEIYRVLGPGGRVMFIVPNRRGLWSRSDATPFGFGRPYSLSQLETQLRRHGFTPELHRAALFSPPSNRRFWLRTSGFWEGLGRKVSSYLAGGVLMIEASKQVPAPRGRVSRNALRSSLEALEGVPASGAKPI